jgi:hypothetical protein
MKALKSANKRHAQRDRGNDLYQTPPGAVEALLRVERLPLKIWEPCCGPGSIVNVLRAHGHEVCASDLNNYAVPITTHWGVDFLMERKAPNGAQCILTNPPYSLATEFVKHALELCPRVIMLLRLEFMAAAKRKHLIPKALRIHVFTRRLVMHRHGWTGKKASPRDNHAWYVFDAGHNGPTQLHLIGGAA